MFERMAFFSIIPLLILVACEEPTKAPTGEEGTAEQDTIPPGWRCPPSVTYITRTSATVSWWTSEPSDSRVSYGLTRGYGMGEFDPAMVTRHSMKLEGLSPGTTYHYQVESTDAAGNALLSNDGTFTTSLSETLVGGVIVTDVTWTKADSPYITPGVVVEEGASLTIEPGVEIRFNRRGRLYVGQTAYEVGAPHPGGELHAVGSKGDEIKFTSDQTKGSWYGVWFNQGSGTIAHCVFEGARDAIKLEETSLTIRDSRFENNATAIWVKNELSWLTVNVQIAGNLFKNNEVGVSEDAWSGNLNSKVGGNRFLLNRRGLDLGFAVSAEVSFNTFSDNEQAIHLGNRTRDVNIEFNTLKNNKVGVYFDFLSGGGRWTPSWHLNHNNIYDNLDYNVYLESTSEGEYDDIDATNNWWGTRNVALIEEKIYDYYDHPYYSDSVSPKVIYIPYATASIPEAP